jgi:hypothetical protein
MNWLGQGDGGNSPANGVETKLQIGNQLLGQLIETVRGIFPVGGATSTTATAGAQTLPANPAGFLAVTLPDGTAVKIPYYNP